MGGFSNHNKGTGWAVTDCGQRRRNSDGDGDGDGVGTDSVVASSCCKGQDKELEEERKKKRKHRDEPRVELTRRAESWLPEATSIFI